MISTARRQELVKEAITTNNVIPAFPETVLSVHLTPVQTVKCLAGVSAIL